MHEAGLLLFLHRYNLDKAIMKWAAGAFGNTPTVQPRVVDLFQDVLTLEYQEQSLMCYSVEWQSDEKHLRRAGNPWLYDHPYRSAQLPLWPEGAVEWYLILHAAPYGPRPRRKKSRLIFLQISLIFESDGTQR